MLITGFLFNQPAQKQRANLKDQMQLDPLKYPPWCVIAVGMLAAFFIFLLLDILEQLLFAGASREGLRYIHFARGFLATSCGMSMIYWVMRRKENELVKLRDHFAEQLDARTEELCNSNKQLLHEVERRQEVEDKLRCLIERLAQSNSSLQQFAKIASHDLQEPLRAINGYAGLLSRRYTGKFDKKADQFLKAMVESTTRMENLIQDIFSYSECKGRRHTAYELIDCNSVVDEAIENLKVSVKENKASITRDSLPAVMGHKWQLVQLFQNLLSNAIKFRGPDSPQIHISAEHRGNEIVFSVCDNGIGIDSRYQEQIFEMFKRLHARREYPGTGIGLAICKSIVENHGGKIWLESELKKGSTFLFSIPCDSSGDVT
jgi:signal transduction histidine kinase